MDTAGVFILLGVACNLPLVLPIGFGMAILFWFVFRQVLLVLKLLFSFFSIAIIGPMIGALLLFYADIETVPNCISIGF
jgi:hypothetical protein